MPLQNAASADVRGLVGKQQDIRRKQPNQEVLRSNLRRLLLLRQMLKDFCFCIRTPGPANFPKLGMEQFIQSMGITPYVRLVQFAFQRANQWQKNF